MKTEIEAAIKALATKASQSANSVEAMQYSQAALNLAQTASVVSNSKKGD
jgi:hypothetical protein